MIQRLHSIRNWAQNRWVYYLAKLFQSIVTQIQNLILCSHMIMVMSTISFPTSRAKEIVFWQSLFGNIDIILGSRDYQSGCGSEGWIYIYIYTYIYSLQIWITCLSSLMASHTWCVNVLAICLISFLQKSFLGFIPRFCRGLQWCFQSTCKPWYLIMHVDVWTTAYMNVSMQASSQLCSKAFLLVDNMPS